MITETSAQQGVRAVDTNEEKYSLWLTIQVLWQEARCFKRLV